MDGGHRFGVTGEYFKRTADFDNMFEQGAGTSYLYGENSVRKNRAPARVAGLQLAPSDGGLLDTVTAALYWQRVSLDTRQTAVRGVDPRAFIIPRDPFRYGFPSGPYGRDNSIRQTMYGVNAEATAPGRRRDAAVDRGRRVVWQQDRAAIQRLRQLPRDPSGTPAPFGPRACDMLHNQADVPQSKGSQWAMWVQDEFGFADGRYADAGAALRPLQAEAREHRQLRQQSQCRQAALGQQRRPLLAQAAGWKAADELSLYAQYAYGFKAPSPSQLYTNYGGAGTICAWAIPI